MQDLDVSDGFFDDTERGRVYQFPKVKGVMYVNHGTRVEFFLEGDVYPCIVLQSGGG